MRSAYTLRGCFVLVVMAATAWPGCTPLTSGSSGIGPHSNDFYASPTGTPEGTGGKDNPWDLATALAQPSSVRPGDTIWLRGGVYRGTYHSDLTGAPGKPVVVRQYPGEHATIDTGMASGAGLEVNGSDAWFWGFEIMSSNPTRRVEQPGSSPAGRQRAYGVNVFGPRTKFINLVVHDLAGGYGFWTSAVDSEIYGNLIYYNGWSGPDRQHGHGVYAQNLDGTKRLEDNIQFCGFGMGLRATGTEHAYAKHFRFIGNVSFDSGYLAGGPKTRWSNFFVSVGSGAEDIVMEDNHSYFPPDEDEGYSNLGWVYSGVEKDVVARGNYWIGGNSPIEVWDWNAVTFTGNVAYSRSGAMALLAHRPEQDPGGYVWDHNRYYGSGVIRYQAHNQDFQSWRDQTHFDTSSTFSPGRPTGVWTFVRSNKYEPGRANVIVYNWDGLDQVAVDVSGVLRKGSRYEVRDAEFFFGPPVASGRFEGGKLMLPMAKRQVAQPIGQTPYEPESTAPEFGVFVVSAQK